MSLLVMSLLFLALLPQSGSIMHARWPEVEPVDQTLLKESEYLTRVCHEFRVRLKRMLEFRGKV